MAERYPAAVYLLDEPSVTVARIGLGITWYLAEPLVWAREAAARAFSLYLAHGPQREQWWYTTSRLPGWHSVGERGLAELHESLSTPGLHAPRHLFSFRLADEPGAPGAGFAYHEVDPRRTERLPYLEVVWPPEHPARSVLRFSQALAEQWPFVSAIGGYLGTWNPREKSTAFWQIHDWCRRYLCLDVQDAEQMGWVAATGLPGSGWLTILGKPFLEANAIDAEALAARPWAHGVEAGLLNGNLVLRAGPEPSLGDLNTLAYPSAYAEVSRALEPYLVKEPPVMYGGFFEGKQTEAWLRRLVEPEGWA